VCNAVVQGASVLLRALEGGELARQVAELQKAIEELQSHAHRDQPAAAGGEDQGPAGRAAVGPDAGPPAGGPGQDHDPGGDDAGPVAGAGVVLPLFPAAVAGEPPEREVPDGGGDRTA